MNVELTSDHYRKSTLVQGGLEINATPRQVTDHYSALVEELYVEPKEEEIFGLFILVSDSKNMDEDYSIHQRRTGSRQ